jgi:hypothetical protein
VAAEAVDLSQSKQDVPPDHRAQPKALLTRLMRATVMTDRRPVRFFTVEQAAEAADDAVRVLRSGPPGRIRSAGPFEGDDILQAPMAWLRENGRYLIPTGTGDAFYAAALGIRNWLALHYVIGTVLLAMLAGVGALRAFLAAHFRFVLNWEWSALHTSLHASIASGATLVDHIWWSSLFPLSAAPLVLAGLPLGIAFWLVHERRDGKSLPINWAVASSLLIAVVMVFIAFYCFPRDLVQNLLSSELNPTQLHPQLLLLFVGAEVLFAIFLYVAMAVFERSAAVQRVLLTRYLSTVLVVTAVITGLAVVDTLGQTLYILATSTKHPGPVLTPAGLAAALVWLAKRSAAKETPLPAWLAKLPTHTLAGFAGILIFVLVGALWGLLVHWIVWDGSPPRPSGDFLATDS